MPLYTGEFNVANISLWPAVFLGQFEAVRSMERGTVEPTIKVVGLLWNDTDDATYGECIKRWNGATWDLLIDLGAPLLVANGSVAMTGNLDLGGQKAINAAAATNAGDLTRKDQVLLRNGSQAMTNHLDMGNKRVTNAAAGSDASDLARVDQLMPGTTGIFDYDDTCQIIQAASESTTFQVCHGGPLSSDNGTFCPRYFVLRIAGLVTDQSDADPRGTLDPIEIPMRRWTGDGGDVDYIPVPGSPFTVPVTMIQIDVDVKWILTGDELGLAVRFRRHDNGEYLNIAVVQIMAWSGVNQ